mgnify:CR=1 FL=1
MRNAPHVFSSYIYEGICAKQVQKKQKGGLYPMKKEHIRDPMPEKPAGAAAVGIFGARSQNPMFFIRPPCAVRTAKSSFIFPFRLFFLRRVCYNDLRLMEKVPFCRFAAACFCSLLPLHPARGRRTKLQPDVRLRCRVRYTPQGDVGQNDTLFQQKVELFRVTPRKGTLEITFYSPVCEF